MAHAAPTSPQSPPNCNVSTPTRNNQCSTFSSYRPLPPLPARNLKRAKLSRVLPSPPATPMFRLVSLGYSPPRRRAGRLLRLASPTPESTTPVSELSDLEFQFSAGVSDSDTDSLPELDDSSTSTASTRSLLTPFRPSVSYFDTFELPLKRLSLAPALTPLRNATYVEDMDVDIQISQPEPISQPSIFEIPELVHKIIVYADAQNTVIPREKTPVCRKPLSFQHALLVHGNEEAAKLAMEGAFSTLQEPQPSNRLNVSHMLACQQAFPPHH